MALGRPDQHDAARNAKLAEIALRDHGGSERIVDQQRIPMPLGQQRSGDLLVMRGAGARAPARKPARKQRGLDLGGGDDHH
ncbi:MAG: hypothetical protein P8Y53_25775 [Pseudolabrys sp.]